MALRLRFRDQGYRPYSGRLTHGARPKGSLPCPREAGMIRPGIKNYSSCPERTWRSRWAVFIPAAGSGATIDPSSDGNRVREPALDPRGATRFPVMVEKYGRTGTDKSRERSDETAGAGRPTSTSYPNSTACPIPVSTTLASARVVTGVLQQASPLCPAGYLPHKGGDHTRHDLRLLLSVER